MSILKNNESRYVLLPFYFHTQGKELLKLLSKLVIGEGSDVKATHKAPHLTKRNLGAPLHGSSLSISVLFNQ